MIVVTDWEELFGQLTGTLRVVDCGTITPGSPE